MNLYLIYLATILSASGFNTYNYIVNKRKQLKIRKRNFVFKKNISSATKLYSSIGDTIPSIYYFGATILSLIPVLNLAIPNTMNNLYERLKVDSALDSLYMQLNDTEIKIRYENGMKLKIMEECGYTIPKKLKEKEIDETSVKVSDDIKSYINNKLDELYCSIYPENEKKATIDEIIMLSDKEYNKRMKKVLKLTKDEDIDINKVFRISDV